MSEPGTDTEGTDSGTTTAPAGGAGRRTSIVTIDQIVSGASNLIPLIWVAHALAPADFGRFSLVILIYLFTQATLRALIGWPLLVHPEDADGRPHQVLGAVTVLSGAAAAVSIVIALVTWVAGSPMGAATLALGLLMPLLCLQDTGRFVGIAQARPGRALSLDLLWLVLMLAGFAVVAASGHESLFWYSVAWAGSGAAAGLWVVVQQGLPRPHDVSLQWLREHWDYSSRSFISATATTAVTLVGSTAIALVSGPQTVGAVRAALMLERPSAALQLAVATSAATDIAREQPDNRGLMAIQRRTLLIATVVAVLNLIVLVLLPDPVGEALLGQMWPLVAPLVLLIGIRVAISASQSGLRAALLGRRQIKLVMYVDILSSVVTIAGLVVGAALADAEGAMWGSLPGLALATVCWWVALRRHLRSAPFLAPDPAAG